MSEKEGVEGRGGQSLKRTGKVTEEGEASAQMIVELRGVPSQSTCFKQIRRQTTDDSRLGVVLLGIVGN